MDIIKIQKNLLSGCIQVMKEIVIINNYQHILIKGLKIFTCRRQNSKEVIKNKINLIDIGCGGGHLVKALEIEKIKATDLR